MSKTRKGSENKALQAATIALISLILLALGAIAALFGIDLNTDDVLNEVDQLVEGQPPAGQAAAGWYEIYFTDPACGPEETRRGGVDATLAEDIGAARRSVDVAAYQIDSDALVDALIAAENRGLTVRVVTDADYGDERSVRRLRNGGISVVEDERSALMHDKFVVIDERVVWTGSMNLTGNGAYCNNNNFVRFDLPELAANYTAEMSEMYDERRFGPTSPVNVVNRSITVDGVRIDNYLGPEDEIAPVLAELITSARQEILFLTFSFTNDTVGEPLADQVRAGLAVRGVFETAGSETAYSYFARLLELSAGMTNAGIRQDGNSRIMHHKVLIIDRSITIFGSYNFSNSANDQNDENVVVVFDPGFASFFVEEFESVWAEALP